MFAKLSMKRVGLLPLLIALILFALPASALELGQAKDQGLVAETASGYLAVVKPSDEVNELVSKINAGRKEAYQDIADKRGIPLNAVEQQAGKKLTE